MPKRRRGGKSKSEGREEKVEKEKVEKEKIEILPPSTPEPEPEEDEEVLAAVEQLLATPTTPKSAPTNSHTAPLTPTTAELQVARTRLTGLLQRVVKPAGGEESESDHDETYMLPGRPLTPPERAASPNLSPPPAKIKAETPSSVPLKPTTKRRKKRDGLSSDPAFHHTYVMKLFDRSVDLAQFNETTSLYPVCRAWMKNQPRNPNLGVKQRSPSASDDEEEKSEKGDESNEEEEAIKPVHKLPPPRIPAEIGRSMRAPSPEPHDTEPLVVNQYQDISDGRDEKSLLSEHVTRWRTVKSKWMRAGHDNENRFYDSISIIEEIYKKAQELYA